jgi:hypothetical protein
MAANVNRDLTVPNTAMCAAVSPDTPEIAVRSRSVRASAVHVETEVNVYVHRTEDTPASVNQDMSANDAKSSWKDRRIHVVADRARTEGLAPITTDLSRANVPMDIPATLANQLLTCARRQHVRTAQLVSLTALHTTVNALMDSQAPTAIRRSTVVMRAATPSVRMELLAWDQRMEPATLVNVRPDTMEPTAKR